MPPRWSIVLLVLLFCGCSPSDYIEVYSFAGNQWRKGESVVFQYVVTDTLSPATVDISVRYTHTTPLKELPLEVKGYDPSIREFWIDNITIPLGAEHGIRFPNHTEQTTTYRSGIKYPHRGARAISIRHMGDSTLSGIMSIGVVASGAGASGM